MVTIKNKDELAIMRVAGKILARIIKEVSAAATEGVKLKELDQIANSLISLAGCKPAFLGYKPHGANKAYPATICASVNEVIVHGVPSGYHLRNGDILKLDFGLLYPPKNGFYVDSAVTVPIGKISKKEELLINTTREALYRGIEKARPGNRLGDIGNAIESHVVKRGFSIAEGLTGHGIGRELHEEPSVFNYGKRGTGMDLKSGMVIAIEPMVGIGKGATIQIRNEGYAMKDKSKSAHFEHTVAVTNRGPEILTEIL